ncbi:MAG: SMC-Scp complex subunit ScpB [Kiritimatiellia bacterium]
MSRPDDTQNLPSASSLQQVVGALVFGADHPLTVEEIRACLREVAAEDPETRAFADATARDVRDALDALAKELARLKLGIELNEVSSAFRFQSDASCGRWLRFQLRKERPNRLSRPALETLAIIAYRQPIAKSEIEGIRGVVVDHIIKALMELHLVRIVGRSDLPGRPFLYGTTASFLDHFGLKSLGELNEMDPTLQRSKPAERKAMHRKNTPAKPKSGETAADLAAAEEATSEPPDPLQEVLGSSEPLPPNAEPIHEQPEPKRGT